MASYEVNLSRSVRKDLRRIDKQEVPRLVSAIDSLAQTPYPPDSKKLLGSHHSYRLRLGNYRVLYEVEEDIKVISVFKVGHRKEVYR